MYYLTYALLLACAFLLIAGAASVIRAFLDNRSEEAAPFRDYFGSAYDRELLQLSSSSETEDWSADRLPHFTPFRLRVLEPTMRRAAVGEATRRNHESN
jgi:hypothetical protein